MLFSLQFFNLYAVLFFKKLGTKFKKIYIKETKNKMRTLSSLIPFIIILVLSISAVINAVQIEVPLLSNTETQIPCDSINTEYILTGNATNSLIYCTKEGTFDCAMSKLIFNGTFIYNSTIRLRHCRTNLGMYVEQNEYGNSHIENTKFDINNMESFGALRFDFNTAKNVEVVFWKNRVWDDQNSRGQLKTNFSLLWRNNESAENVSFYAYDNNLDTYPEKAIGFQLMGTATRIGKINVSANSITTHSFNAISIVANKTSSEEEENNSNNYSGFIDGIYFQGNSITMTGMETQLYQQSNDDEWSTAIEFAILDSSDYAMPTKGILIQNNNISFKESKSASTRGVYIQPSTTSSSSTTCVYSSSSSTIIIRNNNILMKNGTDFSSQGIQITKGQIANLLIENNIISTNSSGMQSALNISVCHQNISMSEEKIMMNTTIHNNNISVVSQSGSTASSGCTFVVEGEFVNEFNFTSNTISMMTAKDSSSSSSFFGFFGLQVSMKTNATIKNFNLLDSNFTLENSLSGSASKIVSILDDTMMSNNNNNYYDHSPMISTLLLSNLEMTSSTTTSSACPSLGFHMNVAVLKEFIFNPSIDILLESAKGTNKTSSDDSSSICPPSNGGLIVEKGKSKRFTKSLLSLYFPEDKERFQYLEKENGSSNYTINLHLKDLTVLVKDCSEVEDQYYPSRAVSISNDEYFSSNENEGEENFIVGAPNLHQVLLESPLSIEISSEKNKGANMIGLFISSLMLIF